MNHADAIALIEKRFEADTLPDEERRALRAHLRECTDCRRVYDELAEAEMALNVDRAHASAAQRLWPDVEEAAQTPEPVNLTEERRRRRWPFFVAPVIAAGAAAAVLLLGAPTPLESEYGLEMTPSRSDFRGPTAPSTKLPILRTDGELRLVLRPQEAHGAAVEARAYRLRDGDIEPLQGKWEISREGSLRLALAGADALPVPGTYRLAIVVGSEGELPSQEEVAGLVEGMAASPTTHVDRPGWRLWLRAIVRE